MKRRVDEYQNIEKNIYGFFIISGRGGGRARVRRGGGDELGRFLSQEFLLYLRSHILSTESYFISRILTLSTESYFINLLYLLSECN